MEHKAPIWFPFVLNNIARGCEGLEIFEIPWQTCMYAGPCFCFLLKVVVVINMSICFIIFQYCILYTVALLQYYSSINQLFHYFYVYCILLYFGALYNSNILSSYSCLLSFGRSVSSGLQRLKRRALPVPHCSPGCKSCPRPRWV